MWYYISHLSGELFISKKRLDFDDLYCEECGDCDDELGWFETEEEANKAYNAYLGYEDN